MAPPRRAFLGAAAVGHWLVEHPAPVLTGPAVAAEIRRCRTAPTQATGSGGRYSRPSGMTRPSPLVLTEAGAAGYPLAVAYDIDPRDYSDPGPDAITASVAARPSAP